MSEVIPADGTSCGKEPELVSDGRCPFGVRNAGDPHACRVCMRLCLSSSSCGLYCRMTVAPLRPCELGRLRRSTHTHAREKGETSAGARSEVQLSQVGTQPGRSAFLQSCDLKSSCCITVFSYFMDPPLPVTKSQVNVHESDRKHAQLRSNIGHGPIPYNDLPEWLALPPRAPVTAACVWSRLLVRRR